MSYRDAIDVILERIPEAVTDFNGSTAVPGEGWLAGRALEGGGYDIPKDFEKSLFASLFDFYFKQLDVSDIASIIPLIGDDLHARFVAILKSLPGGDSFRPTYKNLSADGVEPHNNNYRWAHNILCRQRISFSQIVEITFAQYPYLKLGKSLAFNQRFFAEQERAFVLRQLDNFSHQEQSLGYCVGKNQRKNLIEFFFEDEVTGMLFLVKNGHRITL